MEYPPLLLPGLHPRTWTQLEQMCVTDIPLSSSRASKFAGLRKMVDRLIATGMSADMWVNGSFLTQKIEPEDVDFVLRLDVAFLDTATSAQQQFLMWVNSTDATVRDEIRRNYACDPYAFCDLPMGHPAYTGIDMRGYWLKQFGVSRSGVQKGIAVLSIPSGVV